MDAIYMPTILDHNEKCTKIQITKDIIITIDSKKMDDDGSYEVNFDENSITAEEAEKIAQDFFNKLFEDLIKNPELTEKVVEELRLKQQKEEEK
jgi:hypothetical protein